MAKNSESLIRITEQPRYKSEISKVVAIGQALSAITDKLEQCRASFAATQKNLAESPDLIGRALALAGGASNTDHPPAVTPSAEIARLEVEQRELRDGLNAANDAVNKVAHELAAEVGASARGNLPKIRRKFLF